MKIAIGCDHGGVVLKEIVCRVLEERNIEIEDCGCYDSNSVDYPDFALTVAEKVAEKECEKGVLLCGTGIGIAIAANKVKGIRCAVCHDEFTALMAAQHNDANILSMGGRVIDAELARKILIKWLDTTFEGGRHAKRVDKITAIEKKYFK